MIKVNGIGFEVSQINFAAHYAVEKWRANGRVVIWFDAARPETYFEFAADFPWRAKDIWEHFKHIAILADSGVRDV